MGEAIGLRVTVRNDTIAITLPGTWFAVTYRVAAVMLFFKGKDIADSLKGWSELYQRVKDFLPRSPALPRAGAARAVSP
jgi:hypothetical protein